MKVRSGKGVFAGVFELLARVVLRRPWAVIGAWLLLVVALSVAVPPLMKLASDRNQELLPSNSAVMAATRDMTAAFLAGFFLSAAAVPRKRLRPGFGGSLAAREPVWDGEGWGCDRVANSIPCCRSARAGR